MADKAEKTPEPETGKVLDGEALGLELGKVPEPELKLSSEWEEVPKPEPDPIGALKEDLDADEKEFRDMRRDLPGVKGSSAAGIVTIGTGKIPGKNEFFRTNPEFRPVVSIVVHEVGLERQHYAVAPSMIAVLAGIGIVVANHTLYLTMTERGGLRIIPVRQATGDREQNEYDRTKEIALIGAEKEWLRLYTDQENGCYKVYSAPAGRFADPQWPELKEAKIFRLAFRDKGRLIDSTDHALFLQWAARKANNDAK
jgi:hypothetical protein